MIVLLVDIYLVKKIGEESNRNIVFGGGLSLKELAAVPLLLSLSRTISFLFW